MKDELKCKFGELPIDIIDGDRSNKYPKKSEFTQDGIPFLNSSAIADGRIDFSLSNYISKQKYSQISKGRVFIGDSILTTRGNGVGKVAIFTQKNCYREALINAQMLVVRARPGLIDPDYLFYLIKSPSFQSKVTSFASGSAQPQLPIRDLVDIPVSVHNYLTQNLIGFVLRTYDDLIENNTRRIKILEEMARMIYREWFVNFRFPGHEQVKMVDSPLGQIPDGWEVKTLGDLCKIVMGQSPKSEFYNEEGTGLPFHQGVADYGDRFPSERIYCTVENRIAEEGDILFSVRAPVGRLNLTTKKIIIGRGLCAIRSKAGDQTFVFQQLVDQFKEVDMMGGGTIFKSVTKEDVFGIKMVAPTTSVIERFESIAKSLFRELEVLSFKNQNLRQTRDLLLPKLISGEVAVSEMGNVA